MNDRDQTRLRRRDLLLSSAAVAMTGAWTGCSTSPAPATPAPQVSYSRSKTGRQVSTFFGAHQPGIVTPTQRHMHFMAFDLQRDEQIELRDLLREWSRAAATLMSGEPPTDDSGEITGLPSARLTVTFGFGPSLFERDGADRLGLKTLRPSALQPLPEFRGDALDPQRSDGDIGIQVCADDAQVAFHAIHTLMRRAHGIATLRWSQTGFTSPPANGETSRNLLGFKDGTRNLDVKDLGLTRAHLWAPRGRWMTGGTYMVTRRIRTLLDVWDATSVDQQERAIGRSKRSGAPLGRQQEHDPPDLTADVGPTAIPLHAHVRLAAPETNNGARILRRGFNYTDGIDHATEQLDAGLFFISFQRDPQQFVTVQRRLSELDALNKHLQTTGSAIFACPPGAQVGGYVGEGLFN